ncbi:MAG: OmpA family protein [Pseudodesulfovibrio sp.]
MKKAFILAVLFALSACANIDPSLTDQTRVYSDLPVRKSSLQVAVHPRSKQFRPLTAYFHPFVVQQPSSDYENVSHAFSEIFHNVWMEDRLFTILEYQPETRYEGLGVALETARRRGADLLILGMVPYFFAGNTLDDSAVTIRINIYNAGNGDLLWSMIQSARIEERQPDDFILVRHEFRMPQGAFDKIIRSIARDMAVPLKAWLPDPDARYDFADNTRDVASALAPATGAPSTAEDARAMEADLPGEDGAKAAGGPKTGTPRPDVKGVNLDIQFDFDKATIRPESHATLDALGQALESPELKGRKIIIAGHTDTLGDEKYNLALSRKRADAVKTYLVDKWRIAPELIETAGYGKSRPLSSGTTKADQQRNRRVEVRLAE